MKETCVKYYCWGKFPPVDSMTGSFGGNLDAAGTFLPGAETRVPFLTRTETSTGSQTYTSTTATLQIIL